MKPVMRFQKNLFWEDDESHLKTIKKYFDEVIVNPDNLPCEHGYESLFQNRLSIALAQRYKCFEKFTNALEWAGKLRSELLDPWFYFTDMDHVLKQLKITPRVSCGRRTKKMFVRPASGSKVFAGNVYDSETFQNEVDFLKQRNVDPRTVICLLSVPVSIKQEYRTIFINKKLVGASRYMVNSELSVDSYVPDSVLNYAQKIHKEYDLPPWVVLDIADTEEELRVIEINQIETSSFYAADLDEIYLTWSKNVN